MSQDLSQDRESVRPEIKNPPNNSLYWMDFLLWPGTELNRRHKDFQSSALPTELPGREKQIVNVAGSEGDPTACPPLAEATWPKFLRSENFPLFSHAIFQCAKIRKWHELIENRGFRNLVPYPEVPVLSNRNTMTIGTL